MTQRCGLLVVVLVLLLLPLAVTSAGGDFNLRDVLSSFAHNNIVIVSEVNCGYLDFASNWLLHARRLGVHNFLLISEDDTAHQHLLLLAPGHIARSTEVLGTSVLQTPAEDQSQLGFGSRAFGELMARRSHYVHAVLSAGFSALLLDLDAVLLRNPMPYLPTTYDYVGVYDSHPNLEWGRRLCTCLMLFRPSPGALALVSRWSEVCAHAGEDQLCFNGIFPELPLVSHAEAQADAGHPSGPVAVLNGTAVSTFVLPRQLFPSGNCLSDFDVSLIGKWNSPVWVHANWMRPEAKRPFLRSLGLWEAKDEHALPACHNASTHGASRRRGALSVAAAPAVEAAAGQPPPKSCPRYMVCSLLSGGLGDLLEHYTFCIYVSQLVQATLVVSPGAFTAAPTKHLGHESYPAAAELLGINVTYVHPPLSGEPLRLQLHDALAYSRGETNVSLPCNVLMRAGMADCPIRWCSNDANYRGLQAVRWKLRTSHPRQTCFSRALGFPTRVAGEPLRVLWHVRTGDVHTNTAHFSKLLATLRALADGRQLRIVVESQDVLPEGLDDTFRDSELVVGSPLLQSMCRFLTADVLVMTGSSFPALVAAFAPPWTPIVLEERRKNRGRDSIHAHHYFTADEALLVEDGATRGASRKHTTLTPTERRRAGCAVRGRSRRVPRHAAGGAVKCRHQQRCAFVRRIEDTAQTVMSTTAAAFGSRWRGWSILYLRRSHSEQRVRRVDQSNRTVGQVRMYFIRVRRCSVQG